MSIDGVLLFKPSANIPVKSSDKGVRNAYTGEPNSVESRTLSYGTERQMDLVSETLNLSVWKWSISGRP